MEFKDYYEILGIKPDADLKTIKTAYRKLAHKFHPDVNPGAGAEAKFKEIAEAYEVLKDEGRRAEYDELRLYGRQSKRGFEPPPDWWGAGRGSYQSSANFDSDFSDFFNSIFGGSTGRARSYAQQPARGQDIEIELPVFLEETVSGESKTIEFTLPVREGGRVKNIPKQLKIKVPKGVADGERIRLKGQGAPAAGNGAAGDLYLHVRLVPHPLFDVQGHNLILTLPVTPWEAALGSKITVPTLQGDISLSIAPNSQTGTKLRIKGKGLSGKNITGDLFAIIKVVMPKNNPDKVRQLWRHLAKEADFDARAEWSKFK